MWLWSEICHAFDLTIDVEVKAKNWELEVDPRVFEARILLRDVLADMASSASVKLRR